MIKAKKKISNKRENLKEPNQSQQLSLVEIIEKINFYWKEIDKSTDYQTYLFNWDNYDKYKELKDKYNKK